MYYLEYLQDTKANEFQRKKCPEPDEKSGWIMVTEQMFEQNKAAWCKAVENNPQFRGGCQPFPGC
jgi:hypothetical protein